MSDIRDAAIEILGATCLRCPEKDKRHLVVCDTLGVEIYQTKKLKEISSDNINGYLLLCGNCATMKRWHPDTFDSVVPKGRASKFDIDLSYGKEREHRFAEMMHSSIEVKSDRQARKTGNIYVEYESRGKPGGIEKTDAKYWAQEVDEDVFVVMTTDRMRTLVKNRLDKYGTTLGGDGKTSKGVLLRVTELVKPLGE